jgi:RNA polymerase sigma-70 factor (ECF subfamily)
LVRRAAGGDLAAFGALVLAHEASLRRYTRRLAGDEGDDIAQDALLAAWRALGQWRGDGSFASWLRRIATRRCLDRRRRAVPSPSLTEVDLPTPGAPSSPDRKIGIDRALGTLQPRERAAALLVFAEGYSHAEAAALLDLPLGTFKSIVARARAALIPLLEGVEA